MTYLIKIQEVEVFLNGTLIANSKEIDASIYREQNGKVEEIFFSGEFINQVNHPENYLKVKEKYTISFKQENLFPGAKIAIENTKMSAWEKCAPLYDYDSYLLCFVLQRQ
jgi:hypothetical protein